MSRKTMTENCVILHNAASQRWLCFKTPHQIITVNQLSNVVPALTQVETLVNRHQWHAAGFVSYEAASAFDPALCTHPPTDFPLLWFGLYSPPQEFSLARPEFEAYSLGDFVPSISQSEYGQAIQRIKQYINAGDTYQVNYTLRLGISFGGDPWNLFLAMVRAQPSGYSAWVDTGRLAVCSASPELFFQLDGDCLTCKPMKGTVKRGRSLAEDESLAEWLRHSEKNRAENVMIVDMIRNDLGRVADVGSVHVKRLFEVTRHPTLWQMTSTVVARCRKSLVEIFTALFPCASITGAPKIRTTQIIAELESTPRGIYTGCVGFIAPNRTAQFNVAIRTAVIDRLTAHVEYGSGGGIVWDSDRKDEYTEALLKARILTEQYPEFSLLETMLWTSEDGYFLLDHHMRRLGDSAVYFDYRLDLKRVREALLECIAGFSGHPHRVRLLVARDGFVNIEATPMSTAESPQPLRVKLARTPIDSAEIFLYHKTTHRGIYENAKRDEEQCDDVLLWNERREMTETCVSNIVVDLDGDRITPPVDSGLLAGTFRARLLEEGRIREQVLKIDDLKRCSRIYLINSVRKWQDAVLI